MGLTMAVALVLESSACRAEPTKLIRVLVGAGTAAGLFGSLVSSADQESA